jgi:ABC-type lipoprotein release transport system permease subunit
VLYISDPRKNPLRTSVVIVAITAAMALVVILSGLSVGVRYSSRKSLNDIDVDLYVVPEDLHPLLTDLQRFDQGWSVQREIGEQPGGPERISPRLVDALFYELGNEQGEIQVIGVSPSEESGFNQFKVVSGNWFSRTDDPVREIHIENGSVNEEYMTMEILLSRSFIDSTHLEVGDEIQITPSLSSNGRFSFKIGGVYVDTLSRLSRSAIIHLGELQLLKGLLEKDTLSEILLGFDSEDRSVEIVEWSKTSDFSFRDIVDIVSREDVLEDIQDFLLIIDGFSMLVISLTLIVCLIFTSTIFMISIKEKSREVAILRAIGIPSGRIMGWIAMESLIIYGIGSILGIFSGGMIILVLNRILTDRFPILPEGFAIFRIDSIILGTLLLLSLLLSLLSTLLPIYRIMVRSPMDSLRGDIS